MNYIPFDSETEAHIVNLLDWLLTEIRNSGGDGDGIWYTKYYNLEDLYVLINKINVSTKLHWKIHLDSDAIYWGEGQEGLLITNNKTKFDNRPSYTQVAISY